MSGRLYAAVLENNGYIVGDANARSGLHVRDNSGHWQQKGWPNIRSFGLHVGAGRILMAAGNGLLASYDDGSSWRVTTDWRITEVLDVDASPTDSDHIVIATAHGPWVSKDGCRTWIKIEIDDLWRFAQSIRFDRSDPGRIVLGAEVGALVSVDAGATWELVTRQDETGSVRAVTQDHRRHHCWWGASTRSGIIYSSDQALTWSKIGPEPVGPLYSVMSRDAVIAATGYRTGVIFSVDRGESWQMADFPEPHLSGHALVMDPEDDSTLFVGTTEDGVFSLDLNTSILQPAGLETSTIRGLYAAD